MNRHILFSVTVCLSAFLGPAKIWADAASDLADGKAALAGGELDKAVGLLTAAAQGLPDSVEAQLALAECQLKLADFEKALQQYRKVLKLSPDHAAAKRIVAALTGNDTSFDKQMAAAKGLMEVGQYSAADRLLAKLVAQPIELQQRDAAMLLRSEVQLNMSYKSALETAQRLIHQSEDAAIVGPAHVLAAFALALEDHTPPSQITRILAGAGDIIEPWKSRAALAASLVEVRDPSKAVDVSGKLGDRLKSIPPSQLRLQIIDKAYGILLTAAKRHLAQGELDTALAILWPMIGSGAIPKRDAVLKPVEMKGGWFVPAGRGASADYRAAVADVLAAIGEADYTAAGPKASLLGSWLSAELMRQTPSDPNSFARLLRLATRLAPRSRPAPDRQAGQPLSIADQIQQRLASRLATLAQSEKDRSQVVDLLLAHIERYKNADDLDTGLAQFVTVNLEANPPVIELAGELAGISPGAAHEKLTIALAHIFCELGYESFSEAIATLSKDANSTVNGHDRVALALYGRVAALYPKNADCHTQSGAIIDRYASAQRWAAAGEAVRLYYVPQAGDSAAWALVHLKTRQAIFVEDQLRAAQRQLGKELAPLVREALTEAIAILKKQPNKATRGHAAAVAESLINRYVGFNRADLAEALIVAMTADKEVTQIADWAIWTRAGLLARQATQALATAAQQFDAADKLPLHALHQAELKLLGTLLSDHPKSEYRSAAVDRVIAISATYQNYRSFDTALAVLNNFVKAHPNLSTSRRCEYQSVQVVLVEAQIAFDEREDKAKAPTNLSDEYVAAIEAIAAFLKKYPMGDYSPAAANQLFEIVRVYGQADAWPVARDVLDRFAAALPDYRSPSHLQLLKAVTFLGQLDRDYALALLTPKPAEQAQPDGPINVNGVAGIAIDVNDNSGNQIVSSIPNLPGQPRTPPVLEPAPGYSGDGTTVSGGTSGIDPGSFGSLREPSESALAMIRQSQQTQLRRIAMLDMQQFGNDGGGQQGGRQGGQQAAQAQPQGAGQQQWVALPTGSVLSEAEMKRQDDAADAAYAILVELIKNLGPQDAAIAQQARAQVLWLFGFFEGQLRFDRAIAFIEKYLADQPSDPAKITLAYRAIDDQLGLATARHPTERINLAWLDERHELFDKARAAINKFVADYADKKEWVHRARLLIVTSYDREAQLAQTVSAVRAGGLLVRSAEALLAVLRAAPAHPQAAAIPQRLWNVTERLGGLQQQGQAIYVLSQLPIRFPTNHLAKQAVLRIAGLYAANLSNPLKAVETYQEYLSLNGEDESVRAQIYSIGQQLATKRRYLEALHVYGIFVDSFPTDARAPEALRAIGQTHQANEAWEEAIASYKRILDEYPGVATIPDVNMAIAECQINLSKWREARRLYEEFLTKYPKHGQVGTAQSRLTVLKNLERFQTLLGDDAVDRNKDDAQYQIGRIVLTQLNNPVKAVAEFRKVVEKYPKSDVADDAQLEIGKALLSLNRLDEARAALLEVPKKFPNSPAADDALYLVGTSYEQHAVRLSSVTVATARQEAYERNQRDAYRAFNTLVAEQNRINQERRVQLKAAGKQKELGLDEASNAFRFGNGQFDNITITSNRAGVMAEAESALQVANRQDRVNEAYREAVAMYLKAAADYPLGDQTDDSLLRVAQIFETNLKDRAAAMRTYQKIVKLFPGTPVAEDAAWKVALFHEQERKYAAAAAAYQEFIRNYPGSSRVADAQFSLAEVFEHLGQWVSAMDAYEIFRQKFQKHPKSRLAVEQINWIKTYRRN